MQSKILTILVAAASITGCATVPPPDLSTIQKALNERANLPAPATLTSAGAADAKQQVQALLGQPLTPTDAMQLALLNSRGLHAELAELGVAQAEVVEAGLISNPRFAVGALRPEGGGGWQLDLGLSQSLMDLMTRSLRKSMAQAEYERAQLEVTERLIRALQEVEAAYYQAVAAAHRAAILDVVAQAAETSSQLANRFYSAGNITELEYLREVAEATQRRLDADEALAAADQAEIALATQVGIDDLKTLQLPTQLPDLPAEQFDSQQMFDRAMAQRLDLQILRQSAKRYKRQLALYERSGGIEELELGVNAEREFDGAQNVGPELAISLPLFHQGQAQIAGARAQILQIEQRSDAMRVAIRNEIAHALTSIRTSRQKLERLRTLVIPQRERIVQLSLQRYNYMLAGVSEALLAKQQEYEAYLEYVDTLSEYWRARSELAMAVGGGLPEPEIVPAPLPQPRPGEPAGHATPDMDHGQHGDMNHSRHPMKEMNHSQHNMENMGHSQHKEPTTPPGMATDQPSAPSQPEPHQQDGTHP